MKSWYPPERRPRLDHKLVELDEGVEGSHVPWARENVSVQNSDLDSLSPSDKGSEYSPYTLLGCGVRISGSHESSDIVGFLPPGADHSTELPDDSSFSHIQSSHDNHPMRGHIRAV